MALTFAHEFGHGLIKVGAGDEYSFDMPYDPQANEDLEKKYFSKGYSFNCLRKDLPPNKAWNNIVGREDYALGCGYNNWYRSSNGSIMGHQFDTPYYNSVTLNAINASFDSILKPTSQNNIYDTSKYKNSSPPKATILVPVDKEKINGPFMVSAEMNSIENVFRTALFIDDELISTEYKPDFGNVFTHVTDSSKFSSGNHTVTIRTYNVLGQSTQSEPITIQIVSTDDVNTT